MSQSSVIGQKLVGRQSIVSDSSRLLSGNMPLNRFWAVPKFEMKK